MQTFCKIFVSGLFLLSSLSCFSQDWDPPEQGILDLRSYDFSDNFYLNLNGEWEFYWEKFISPEVLHSPDPPAPTMYVNVPDYWTGYSNEEFTFPGSGYATYRLRILLPDEYNNSIGIDMPVFDASVSVFIDGRKFYSSGAPGKSENESEAGYRPATLIVQPQSEILEILLHVSNFQHRRGGFWKSIKIGNADRVIAAKQRYRLIGNISLGILMAFSLFFFFFFIYYRKDKLILFFSLILAGIFIRVLNTDLYSIKYVFDIPWLWTIRLEYLGTFLAFGAAIWYFHLLFPAKYMIWINRTNTFLVVLAALCVLLFDARVFSYTMLYFQPAVVMVIIYYLFACIRSIIRGDRDKILFLAGLLLFLGGLANDILVANSFNAVSNRYIVHFTLQIFIFIQAISIIRTWIRANIEREKLMKEIEYINFNLENMVDQRTLELNRRNKEIQDKNEDIEARNKELNEALDFKNRIFSIIAHDLKSPVASLVQNSALLDYDLDKENSRKLIDSFREQSGTALHLIDNLLYWGRSQGNQLINNPELVDAGQIIGEVVKLFGQIAIQKNITLEWERGVKNMVFADRELLEITCRNLVSNAIKFTERGGKVTVSISRDQEKDRAVIAICDNGVGISDDKLRDITGDTAMISTAGTEREKGTGLGLKLCKELVQANNGKIEIESKMGEGTCVYIRLPSSPDRNDNLID